MTALTAPQWVEVYGHHGTDAVFEDPQGPARIPLRMIPALSHTAAINGRVNWGGRTFDRDVLLAVRRDLLAGPKPFGGLASLDTCATDGCDEAAPFDLRDGRPACAQHKREE